MLVCTNCKRELNDNTYDEHTIYHNCIEGVCKLCGYEGHWTDFIKEIEL